MAAISHARDRLAARLGLTVAMGPLSVSTVVTDAYAGMLITVNHKSGQRLTIPWLICISITNTDNLN